MEEPDRSILRATRLNPELANPSRFLIMTYLYLFGPKTVSDIAKALGLTYGSLDSNLRRLQEKGYVEIKKVLTLRGPRTLVKLTEKGVKEYRELVRRLRALLETIERDTRDNRIECT